MSETFPITQDLINLWASPGGFSDFRPPCLFKFYPHPYCAGALIVVNHHNNRMAVDCSPLGTGRLISARRLRPNWTDDEGSINYRGDFLMINNEEFTLDEIELAEKLVGGEV